MTTLALALVLARFYLLQRVILKMFLQPSGQVPLEKNRSASYRHSGGFSDPIAASGRVYYALAILPVSAIRLLAALGIMSHLRVWFISKRKNAFSDYPDVSFMFTVNFFSSL